MTAPRARPWLLLALLSTSCGASGATLVNAAVNTTVAASVSASRRANGECYTPCREGTTCDPETGYCVRVPCDGRCRVGERCLRNGVNERCVSTIEPASPDAPAPAPGQRAPPPKPAWLP